MSRCQAAVFANINIMALMVVSLMYCTVVSRVFMALYVGGQQHLQSASCLQLITPNSAVVCSLVRAVD